MRVRHDAGSIVNILQGWLSRCVSSWSLYPGVVSYVIPNRGGLVFQFITVLAIHWFYIWELNFSGIQYLSLLIGLFLVNLFMLRFTYWLNFWIAYFWLKIFRFGLMKVLVSRTVKLHDRRVFNLWTVLFNDIFIEVKISNSYDIILGW